MLQLVLYVLAGVLACAWLRELDLPRGPALAGGLAFALAPYRVEQSVGHLLGPVSVLLPLALWAFERARRGRTFWLVLAAGALASIPLSGQVHLALGAIPFFVLYAACRTRAPRLLAGVGGGVLAAVGAGILVREAVIKGSTQAGGRTLAEVRLYSAHWSDFLGRHVDHARSEQFVYLGWATPLLALAGLVVLVRSRRIGLAVALGVGALVPVLLALGTTLPTYSPLFHALPPFRFPRVPERLLPIACLSLAGLVAVAVARSRRNVVVALVLLLLLLDLHVRIYGRSATGDPAALAAATRGRLLELPVFDPDVHYGSVYLWYDTAAQRQRPGGYSTTAPLAAKATARRLERLNCGDWSGGTAGLLERMGVGSIALHLGLFDRNSAVPDRSYFARRGLAAHGWSVTATAAPVWLFGRSQGGRPPALPEPPHGEPVFCQGWYGQVSPTSGRFMSEEHAPFWIYGAGALRLRFEPSPLRGARFTVDERPGLHLGRRGWHVVTVDLPRLVQDGERKVGLRLLSISTSPSRGSRSRRTGPSP